MEATGQMIKNFILNQTNVPLLSKALDVYSIRQKAISSNIANVSTPGYRRKEVAFEELLQTQMNKRLNGKTTDPRHTPLGRIRAREIQPVITEDRSGALPNGVNNVDIDKEIIEQVKNEIRFSYATRLAGRNLNALRASIKGRFDR